MKNIKTYLSFYSPSRPCFSSRDVAMRYTNEVNWTLDDFIVMGLMLLITGVGIEVVATDR